MHCIFRLKCIEKPSLSARVAYLKSPEHEWPCENSDKDSEGGHYPVVESPQEPGTWFLRLLAQSLRKRQVLNLDKSSWISCWIKTSHMGSAFPNIWYYISEKELIREKVSIFLSWSLRGCSEPASQACRLAWILRLDDRYIDWNQYIVRKLISGVLFLLGPLGHLHRPRPPPLHHPQHPQVPRGWAGQHHRHHHHYHSSMFSMADLNC